MPTLVWALVSLVLVAACGLDDRQVAVSLGEAGLPPTVVEDDDGMGGTSGDSVSPNGGNGSSTNATSGAGASLSPEGSNGGQAKPANGQGDAGALPSDAASPTSEVEAPPPFCPVTLGLDITIEAPESFTGDLRDVDYCMRARAVHQDTRNTIQSQPTLTSHFAYAPTTTINPYCQAYQFIASFSMRYDVQTFLEPGLWAWTVEVVDRTLCGEASSLLDAYPFTVRQRTSDSIQLVLGQHMLPQCSPIIPAPVRTTVTYSPSKTPECEAFSEQFE